MKSIESTGKNLNQAIENGLKELGVSADEVSVQVISAGGLFSKCKVLLTVNNKPTEKPTEKVEVQENKNASEPCDCNTDCTCGDDCDCNSNDNCGEHCDCGDSCDDDCDGHCDCEECDCEEHESNEDQASAALENFKKEQATDEAIIETIAGFITTLGELSEMPIKALVQIDDEAINVSVKGEGAGNFVGNHGETMQAVQYLINTILMAKLKESRRAHIDIDNYKVRREEEIITMAKRMARQVVKTKHPIKLRYMNSYERRIVHSALQNDLLVETFSTGVEPRRFLTITLKRDK